ncbi:hypothetical protein QJQ45_014026 [Haematococcus lacustris]|nr:hypothetical protein QJQ45_014026 [Haematococcus lacustris]
MPRSVVSDRGPQFHNRFWAEVTKLLQLVQAEYLPLVEFAINNAWQESVRSTPFYLNYGYHPRLAELLDLPQKVPQAHDFVKGMKKAVEQARQCLARAQKRMKSYQDNKRREVLYLPGDMVLLSTQNMRGKANQPGVRKLKPRYVGPFSVQYMVGKAAVKLWLPDEWSRLHNVFHWLDGEPQYTVEKVVGHRLEPSKGKRKGKSKKRRLEFLVKWQGHGDEHNTWELSTQLVGCQELMARDMAEHNLSAEAEEAADGEAEAKDEAIKEAYAAATRFVDEAFTSQLYQHEGLWLTEWGRVVVPDDAALRKKVIHTMHDTRSAGHLGMTKTLEQVTRWFRWPGVSDNVKSYVRSCHSCQVNKSSAKKPAGLLQPLPIPERPWDSVSMDLIVKLLASGPNKYDSILVFVDRLTKMVHLVKTWESITATQYAKLFLENVFRLHGMPRSVVSDRGPQFHNRFWAEVTKLLQLVQVNLSSAYHPETDGQTERVNRKVPQAHDFVKGMKKAVEQARQCLARAQKRMKSYQDNKRREVLYLPGDMVLLSTQNMRGKANQPGVRKLKPRYVGPFSVQYMVGKAAVKLWLPDEWSRLHNVFHWLDGEPQYTVEKVVGHRLEPSKGKRKGKSKKRRLEFLVKWQGHGDEHNTWELSTQLVGCQELMARDMAEHNLSAEAEEAADGEAEAKDEVEAEAQA